MEMGSTGIMMSWTRHDRVSGKKSSRNYHKSICLPKRKFLASLRLTSSWFLLWTIPVLVSCIFNLT